MDVGGEVDVVVDETRDVVRVVDIEVVRTGTLVVMVLCCKFCNRRRVVPRKKLEFGKVLHN